MNTTIILLILVFLCLEGYPLSIHSKTVLFVPAHKQMDLVAKPLPRCRSSCKEWSRNVSCPLVLPSSALLGTHAIRIFGGLIKVAAELHEHKWSFVDSAINWDSGFDVGNIATWELYAFIASNY